MEKLAQIRQILKENQNTNLNPNRQIIMISSNR
jgi:hypothetical protein